MSAWAEIDALKKKLKTDFDTLASKVYALDKRAGNSVKVLEDGSGRLFLRYDGKEFTDRSSDSLFERFQAAHAAVQARSK